MSELTEQQKEDIKTVFGLIEEHLDKHNQFDLSLLRNEHTCVTTACFIGWNGHLDRMGITDVYVQDIMVDTSEEFGELFEELCYNTYDEEITLPHFPKVSKVEDVTFDYFKEVFYEKFGIED